MFRLLIGFLDADKFFTSVERGDYGQVMTDSKPTEPQCRSVR